jgi:hypothetical protein
MGADAAAAAAGGGGSGGGARGSGNAPPPPPTLPAGDAIKGPLRGPALRVDRAGLGSAEEACGGAGLIKAGGAPLGGSGGALSVTGAASSNARGVAAAAALPPPGEGTEVAERTEPAGDVRPLRDSAARPAAVSKKEVGAGRVPLKKGPRGAVGVQGVDILNSLLLLTTVGVPKPSAPAAAAAYHVPRWRKTRTIATQNSEVTLAPRKN